MNISADLQLNTYTVAEYLNYLNSKLVPDKSIVRGEVGDKVSTYTGRTGNFTIFSLIDTNDQTSKINCFAWNNQIETLGLNLEAGMEVEIVGYPQIRSDRGELRFQVQKINLLGAGLLRKQFEALKKKLTEQGYFDRQYKKSIPDFCTRIGLITSKFGRGAKKDFLINLNKHNFQIYFYDVRVEGSTAINDICEAIKYFNENPCGYDVLVLIRGGGSPESLQSFNSEEIAKAIFASKIPIIVGVGHEDDETIACLVSDCRVSTPTGAAEILNVPWDHASTKIKIMEQNLFSLLKATINGYIQRVIQMNDALGYKIVRSLDQNKHSLSALSCNIVNAFKLKLSSYRQLETTFRNNFSLLKSKLERLNIQQRQLTSNFLAGNNIMLRRLEVLLKESEEKLKLVNPELKLKQGYSISTHEDTGKVIKDIHILKQGDKIKTRISSGTFSSEFIKINTQQ